MNGAATHLEHDQAQELFGLFVDQELAPGEQEALERHLDGCADCAADLAQYERTVAAVRSLERERAPRELTAQVMKRVRRRRRSLFAAQGARFFEHVSVPVEAVVPVVIAAIAAAAVILLLHAG